MKKHLFFLMFVMLSVVSLQAQFAKPLKNKHLVCSNTSSFSFGVTGSFAANDMYYTAVTKSILTPYLAPTFGVAAEWNTMHWIALGLDASYAMRGTTEAFATEFLTSYTTTTFARVNYRMDLNGLEIRLPITFYLGYDDSFKPYLYVAPRFDYWLKGNLRWERTYDDESYTPLVYETEPTKATMRSYDLSAVAGLGLCQRIMISHTQLFLKFDLSYGMSVLSNFAQQEVDETVTFQGWGDIGHETLGKRYLRNAEARLTLLIPLSKPLKDACSFEQKMKKQQ